MCSSVGLNWLAYSLFLRGFDGGSLFIDYYNHTMAHPFDWTYTGRPLHRKTRTNYCPPHRARKKPSNVKLAELML